MYVWEASNPNQTAHKKFTEGKQVHVGTGSLQNQTKMHTTNKHKAYL